MPSDAGSTPAVSILKQSVTTAINDFHEDLLISLRLEGLCFWLKPQRKEGETHGEISIRQEKQSSCGEISGRQKAYSLEQERTIEPASWSVFAEATREEVIWWRIIEYLLINPFLLGSGHRSLGFWWESRDWSSFCWIETMSCFLKIVK